ncbi:hypothetical protein IAU59_003436 [Kwoniella sp. CBS 9459]
MLQQDPANRLSIEGILTHPWFKMTLVDRLRNASGDSHSVPPSPNPHSPLSGEEFFAEPFNRTASSSRLPHVAAPSPLSMHQTTVPYSSAPSDTSVDQSDGKTNSAVTTPPTSTDEDGVHRVNSCEFSATEKALELLHPNSSQSTIRRAESPGTSVARNRIASKTPLEGQVTEEDEDDAEEGQDEPASLPNLDDHSLHLPVAGHSRTPSRTKRRSVSSTLSVERRQSHHSTSGQWQRYHPEDYLAKLNEEHPPPFSTASEKHLLTQLNDMGLDIGQLRHSVENDACDSSAAMWWILRAKQAERGETDDVIEARAATAARKREQAAAYAREERRKAREASATRREQSPEIKSSAVTFKEETSSIPVTPTFTVMDLGAPIAGPSRLIVASPEHLPGSPGETLNVTPSFELKPPPNMLAATAGIIPARPPPPTTPPRDTPIASPEASPAQRERTKTRSPSMTMLQRATSAWVGTKKTDDDTTSSPTISDKRSTSPTKLHKPPPKKALPRSESDNTMLSRHAGPSTPLSTPQRDRPAPLPLRSPMSHVGTAVDLSEDAPLKSPTHSVTAEELVGGTSKQKGSKRDSLWTTFRHLFNEDKRRRKRNPPGSPLATSEVKMAPAVVLSRGANARAPYINRTPAAAPGSRRTSLDGRPPLYSRRSSSINSRRSSIDGAYLHEHADQLGNLSLHRRTSQRSHGSQTPTSDREYVDHPSRPGSSHSLQRGSSRRSSMSMRSPSLQSDNTSGRFKPGAPPSPLHNYRRRAPGGNDSTRVRHIRVIPESQILRPSSVASSIKSVKSNTSSRASSVDGRRGDSEIDDSGRDETASLRSQQRRRKSEGRKHSLAHQIHRTRSPLSAQATSQASEGASSGKKGPIRDVFQKNKDDDWISEEEEEYAGGLGQASASANGSVASAGKMWVNGTRAAAFPNTNASASSMKIHTPVAKRRGRKTSLEEKEESQSSRAKSSAEPKGLGIGVDNSGRVRRGLPPNRSAAPVIEEEEEEEE